MFAALTFDRDPLSQSGTSFWTSLNDWVQTAGGLAAFCFLVGLVILGLRRRGSGTPTGGVGRLVLVTGSFTVAVYVFLAFLYGPELIAWWKSDSGNVPPPTPSRARLQNIFWTIGGALGLLGVLLPMVPDLLRLSPRRIGALARLSFKEAVRRKILWVFLGLLLVVLFGAWFIPSKFEDQVRTYVHVVAGATALLLILAPLLLASFGIPDDIRHQTIHTVLTKPVLRFEIFLGRYLGYLALMTLVLLVVTGFGLLYVLRGVSQEAADESLKARVPIWGNLHFEGFEGAKERPRGDNVGREWDYRSYIYGPIPNQPPQYAVWTFKDLPAELAQRDTVRIDFTFDIYRTTKGREGEGVLCTFLIQSRHFDAANPSVKARYDERRRELLEKSQKDSELSASLAKDPRHIDKLLAREFGYFEVPAKEIMDYHTQGIDIPGAVIANALSDEGDKKRSGEPALRVRVRCDTRTQYVGMAKYDLYLRQDDPEAGNDRMMFCLNFFKASFGLWLRLSLVVGVAVAISTYLSGVITFMTTGILYILGFFQEFITSVAKRENVGGGPTEAMIRLLRKPGGESIASPLEQTAGVRAAENIDKIYSWTLQRFLEVIPDVDRYTFTDWLAEGVSIPMGDMLWSFALLVGYIIPWAVLAYYLLKWREVASST